MPETKIPKYVRLIDGNIYETCGGSDEHYFLKGWVDSRFRWNCIRRDDKRIIAVGDTLDEVENYLQNILSYKL